MKLLPDNLADLATHPIFYSNLEPQRMMVEMGWLYASAPLILPLHTADGHPVLVVTGMCGSNLATLPMRMALRVVGHQVYTPPALTMQRSPKKIVQVLVEQVDKLYAKHHDKVSLVGWSVGGAFTRMAAFQTPNHLRQVINLGAPLDGPWYPRDRTYAAGPLPVPSTVVYSRTDGFMEWRRVVQESGPQAENIEVISSHFGMMNNPMTLHLLADRLAQPKGVWAPYAGLVLSDLIPNQFLRSMDQKSGRAA
ncbi:MAG: esterase/lipase family protein [Dermatophilaceae bacterium]